MSETYNDPNKLRSAHKEGRFVFNDYWRVKRLAADERREKGKEHYDAYRSVLNLKDDGLTSKIVHPLIWTNVEDALPRLVANLPRVEVGPRGPEDVNRARKNTSLLFWDWDIIKMAIKLIQVAKSAEVFGTCFTKSVWKKKVETRMGRQIRPTVLGGLGVADFFNQPSQKIDFIAQQVPVYNDPAMTIPWPDEIFEDLGGTDIDSCRFIIHRVKQSLHDLQSAKKDGDEPLYRKSALAALKKRILEGGNPLSEPEETIERHVRSNFKEEEVHEADPQNREVHLLEWWSDTKVVVVVEEYPDIEPLRAEYNVLGRKPFNVFTPIMDINSLRGISVPETLMSFQVELSLLHSANLDNVLYSVHQMWKVLETSGINPQSLRFRAGGVVPVKNMTDIQPLDRNFADFSLYRTMDEVRRMSQEAGFTSTFGGRGDNLSGGTATEASILFEASQSRVSLMFQILGLQYLNEWGRLNVRLNELFMDEDKQVRVLGDDFQVLVEDEVTPEDLLTGTGLDLDVKIDIAQTEPSSRQFRLAKAKDMLATFANSGLPPSHPAFQFAVNEMLIGYGTPQKLAGDSNEQALAIEQAVTAAEQGGPTESGQSIPEGTAEKLAVAASDAAPEQSNQGIESLGAFLQ